MIDPFPRPNKKLTTQEPFLLETPNCDIDFLRKSNPTSYTKTSDVHTPTTSPQNNEAMRENIMRELMETEENYVKILSSLCIGYIAFKIKYIICIIYYIH